MSAVAQHRESVPVRGDRLRALLELRHARLRLELAYTDVAYATTALASGHITADAALDMLEDAFDCLQPEGGR